MKKALLIDGNSIMNRAFYATMGGRFTSTSGVPTNAIYGFLQIVLKMIEDEKPTHIAVSFDLKAKLKRKELYAEYKEGRHKTPEDLLIQLEKIYDVVEAMNIPIYIKEGDEADDVIGTIGKKLSKEGYKVLMLSGDRDYFQLVDENILIKYPKKVGAKTEYVEYDLNKISEEYEGLNPNDLIQLKALMGDSSDNIPGVKGIGEKTALKLIINYGSLDGLYDVIENYEQADPKAKNIAPKVREKLINDKEMAYLSLKLGEIDTNVDIDFKEKDMEYTTWKNNEIYNILNNLSIKSLIDKYDLRSFAPDDGEMNSDDKNTLDKIMNSDKSEVESDQSKLKENKENKENKETKETEKSKKNTEKTEASKDKEIEKLKIIDEKPVYKSEIREIQNYLDIMDSKDGIYDANFTNELVQSLISKEVLEVNSYNESKDKLSELKKLSKTSKKMYVQFIYNTLEKNDGILNYYYFKDSEDNPYKEEYDNILKSTDSDEVIENVGSVYDVLENLYEDIKNEYESENSLFEDPLNSNVYNNTRHLFDKKEFQGSISKKRELFSNVLVLDGSKLKIYTVLPNDIKDELESEEIQKVMHKSKDHMTALREDGINVSNISFDTEIAAYLLDSNLGKYFFEDIAKRHLKLDISSIEESFKNEREAAANYIKFEKKIISALKRIARKKDQNDAESKISKLKKDIKEELERINSIFEKISDEKLSLVLILYMLEISLISKLESIDNLKLFNDIEMPLVNVLSEMQFNGMYLDTSKLEALGKELKSEVSAIENRIKAVAGYDINISSPQQIGKLLFEDLEIPAVKKTKTGYSTDYSTLKKIEELNPVVTDILEHRELNKLITTYIDGLRSEINTKTGNIHSKFNQTVTGTGRISSTEPNMQNIPVRKETGQKIRELFEPVNYKFIDADYSQIELRVLADMSDDTIMTKAFKDGLDIHRSTASTIFNIPLDEIDKKERNNAKAINFGIIYGISNYGLSEGTGLNMHEAKEYIEKYLSKYKGIDKFMKDTVNFAKANEYVLTKYNRRRAVPGINSSNYLVRESAKRIAMNAPIQGTAADIMKIAMNNIYKELKKQGLSSKIVLQVHDEIMLDTVKSEMEKVKNIIISEMEGAASLKSNLKADIDSGDNWNDVK